MPLSFCDEQKFTPKQAVFGVVLQNGMIRGPSSDSRSFGCLIEALFLWRSQNQWLHTRATAAAAPTNLMKHCGRLKERPQHHKAGQGSQGSRFARKGMQCIPFNVSIHLDVTLALNQDVLTRSMSFYPTCVKMYKTLVKEGLSERSTSALDVLHIKNGIPPISWVQALRSFSTKQGRASEHLE